QAACIASEPALHANSRSAALTQGVAPIASATMVLDGLTAYGFDSVPTQTARMTEGATPDRRSAPRAASIAMVTVSSSAEGTDFSRTGSRASSDLPQAEAMVAAAMRG